MSASAAKIWTQPQDGDELRQAALSGSVDMVRHLLGKCDLASTDENGQNALLISLKNGHLKAAQEMLVHAKEHVPGVKIVGADHDGARPLCMAVLMQDIKVVRGILAMREEEFEVVRCALGKASLLENAATRLCDTLYRACDKTEEGKYRFSSRHIR